MKGEFRLVGGTCTVLVTTFENTAAYPMAAIIRNESAGTIYLGHSGVTTSNGFPLKNGESLEVDMINDRLFGIATVTTSISILRRGD